MSDSCIIWKLLTLGLCGKFASNIVRQSFKLLNWTEGSKTFFLFLPIKIWCIKIFGILRATACHEQEERLNRFYEHHPATPHQLHVLLDIPKRNKGAGSRATHWFLFTWCSNQKAVQLIASARNEERPEGSTSVSKFNVTEKGQRLFVSPAHTPTSLLFIFTFYSLPCSCKSQIDFQKYKQHTIPTEFKTGENFRQRKTWLCKQD